MTLYEMTAQANALYELLQSEEIDEQVFSDTLEAIGVEEKIESYCHVIKELQGDLQKYKSEIDRLTARKSTLENGVERMKKSLMTFLKATGQEKVKAGTFSVSIGKSDQTNILDESLIPAEYRTPQPDKIEKTPIKAAIKSGVVVPGAELIINESVRIR